MKPVIPENYTAYLLQDILTPFSYVSRLNGQTPVLRDHSLNYPCIVNIWYDPIWGGSAHILSSIWLDTSREF